MANDEKTTGRPRPSPTIDLKATEISSAPTAGAKKPKESRKAAEAPRTEASQPEAAPPPPNMGSGQRRTTSWLMPAVIAAGAGLPLFLLGWWLGDFASGGTRVVASAPVPPEIIARLD